jgi:hypothetical protein
MSPPRIMSKEVEFMTTAFQSSGDFNESVSALGAAYFPTRFRKENG